MSASMTHQICLLGAMIGIVAVVVQPSVGQTPHKYPDIPQAVTSFGAAIEGSAIYLYGGHEGDAHSYWRESQGKQLWRLDLRKPTRWESIATGPPLQGLAMVACAGKLYRIGGFTAKNKEGDEHDLWSQKTVACFDPQTGKWSEAPELPEPRSSFDAAVLDGRIYVIGGWSLQGRGAEEDWLTTAYSLDVAHGAKQWQALPKPPFQRRALAVAAHDGKIFAIGGMQQRGGPTTRVDVYDPKSKQWKQGPSLDGEPMNGFGGSAFATGGRLYVSTIDGSLQRLSSDGSSWETITKLPRARFFHRMLPLDDHHLIVLGGANMQTGKYTEVDVIEVK